MDFQLDFIAGGEIPSSILKTKNYFGGQGFKLIRDEEEYLEFKRGSLLVNRFTFNSLKWKSKTKITFSKGGKVHASFNIDTTHQLVIKKEIDKWNAFIESYKRALS